MASQHATEQQHTNRLINETSPYLLQHAHNPVDWYPWGEEALAAARESDRPILLSIGYAACHWCHVMERESFEDPHIAELMNKGFICIKVDREERPDLDAIYMDAVQAMSGHGGWPMTVFLTPEGNPFYGGTYFPPQDHHGLPSFRKVLEAVLKVWETRRDDAMQQGRELVDQIERFSRLSPSDEPLDRSLLQDAVTSFNYSFDHVNGGFGRAPKFPQPPTLEFLLRMAGAGDDSSSFMVKTTLRKMALGGIYDQVGGGFARYSVDAEWLVPHFEKMLYDNAQLARVYTHAWQLFNAPLFQRIATETIEYLVRDMRDSYGGFYSSEDADSEGEEGKFYVWSYDEFMSLAPEAREYYGVTPAGNFEGKNILTAAGDDPPLGPREKLFAARALRVRPGRDEKILTSWNGLAIAALAEAGAAFGRRDFIEKAAQAADFLLEKVAGGDGRLFHSYKDGRVGTLGMLEDYAYLADALLALWEVTFEPRWFERCQDLVGQMIERFWDDRDGGFFSTGSDHEKLILRQKELIESVTPSPNAVAALVMQRLFLLTDDKDLERRAEGVLRLAHNHMAGAPQACGTFLSALDFWLSIPKEIVIIGDRLEAAPLEREVWSRFLPNKVVAGAPPGIDLPLLEGKTPLEGKPTAFVCEHHACQRPTSEPDELARQLAS
ncbi:MAG: thioredoxin domain-containing protein [Actinomycetota bacterium]|nr:thioredoxin domain-containing protein [Actinomycetota bacterium]